MTRLTCENASMGTRFLGRDQLIYNFEFLALSEAIDRALAEIAPDEDTLIAFNPYLSFPHT